MSDVKLGSTYRHYKTHGLYTALQLVRLMLPGQDPHLLTVREVKYTGNGPLDGTLMFLCYSLSSGWLFVRHTDRNMAGTALVLYYSHEAKDYFVRPLSEFTKDVVSEETSAGRIWVPRFALVSP